MSRTTKLLYESAFGHSEVVGLADKNLRRAVLKTTIFLGIIMTISFSSYTYKETGIVSEYLFRLFGITLPFIVSFILMSRSPGMFFPTLLVLVPLFSIFVSMFYAGGSGLFQGLWVLCIPSISVLAGIEAAIIFCSIVFVSMLSICFIPNFGHEYPHEVSFRYLAVYVTNCILIFVYTISRNRLHHEFVRELKAFGQIDSLTGLFNRRGFQIYAEELWKQAVEDKLPLSILIIDIHNFKEINDKYGYQIGDSFLIKCVKILKHNTKSSLDLIVRSSGKEFCMFLFNTTQEETKNIAQEIKLSIEKEIFTLDDKLTGVSVQEGIESVDFAKKDGKQHVTLNEMIISASQNLQ
ncbi:MAG: GGDEF domain-containing protein [Chitinispirillales bacterium]|jgi:diguanylate cyclase (GGDEF)-like protein|nr:GGDEF domain-containing protein [Chitinispirillales bacterium]